MLGPFQGAVLADVPSVNGGVTVLDVVALFETIAKRGGVRRVQEKSMWKEVYYISSEDQNIKRAHRLAPTIITRLARCTFFYSRSWKRIKLNAKFTPTIIVLAFF